MTSGVRRLSSSYSLGVDVGGTFTDFILWNEDGDQLKSLKVLTTPSQPSKAIFSGLDRLCAALQIDPSAIKRFVHGTTLVANALIERRGAKTALLTTKGFRDTLEFRDELRYDLFEPHLEFPTPLIDRSLRFEIDERLDQGGKPLKAPDRAEIDSIIENCLDVGVESIAICFLHAYLNPDHEEQVAEIVHELAPDLPVSISTQVLRQVREYERMSAVAINAYVRPIVDRYLSELVGGLSDRGYSSEVLIMTSTGGAIAAKTAALFPVHLVESGPAAGVVLAARRGAQRSQDGDLVAFDMGGTTAKVCVVKKGRPDIRMDHEVARTKRFKSGSGLPVGVPVLDLLEIGAGGGSIAELDATGLLRVGPRSAGADPGPACYGSGGAEPTVTDANLVLGLLSEETFLGGEKKLDKRAAEDAVRTKIARPGGMDLTTAALGIYRIVTETMAEALRVRSVESNVDLRNYELVAFGGAAGCHAVDIARRLNIPRVLCPAKAGVFSAGGLLAAPLAVDLLQSWIVEVDDLSADEVRMLFSELEKEASEFLVAAGAEEWTTEYWADISYVGQEFPIRVRLPYLPRTEDEVSLLTQWFEDEYEATRGLRLSGYRCRVTTWRIRVAGPDPRLPDSDADLGEEAPVSKRDVFLDGDWAAVPVYVRTSLRPDQEIVGPAIIQDVDTTIVVPTSSSAIVDRYANVVISASGIA